MAHKRQPKGSKRGGQFASTGRPQEQSVKPLTTQEDTPTAAPRFHPDIPDEAREFWDDVAIMAAPDDDRLAQRLFESDERIMKVTIYHDGWIEVSKYDWHKCRAGVCIGKSYAYSRDKRRRLPLTYNRHRHGGIGPRVDVRDAHNFSLKSFL